MSHLTGKTILITGAAGGFGRELTKQLLEKGADLILTDLNTPDANADFYLLRRWNEKIRNVSPSKSPGRILGTFSGDLRTQEGCKQVYQNTLMLSPKGVDVLINNAGLAFKGGLLEVPDRNWNLILDVNLYAPIHLSRLFVPAMLERKQGHIVNLSSVAGQVAPGELIYYSVSKFGIRALGEAMDADLRKKGVAVTNVYPFFADTGILKSQQFGKQQEIPMSIVDSPVDVVKAIVRGMEKRKLHVFPGIKSKTISFFNRMAPNLVHRLAGLSDRFR
ncbi:SDR family oxidoreductase [Leptospira gomenensis]|uniref:SDR family oxidoreductase n=1 Tax=Leptospira gomenensis TaxID=2484974 RepID=A0A5F1YYY6_9LEPT|nr:SDR family oxidoreductase [Leptospira gomenensis]TGK39198.1 SDR family oxidoreductase [Leptospira gomenensis]TGK44261.1 SDR family oxidoreductase [Leptospira gomenensis]TGK45069.1 SDR family oxidoreductase [Leptospira gomenensis]TGK65123.1 SDR family oxidoreductase [Leptospira gomenensis]